MTLYHQCATCGQQLILGEGVFCDSYCKQMYDDSHVKPLLHEHERLDTDHMDDMIANENSSLMDDIIADDMEDTQ